MNHILIWVLVGLSVSWLILLACIILFFIMIRKEKEQEKKSSQLPKMQENHCVTMEGTVITEGKDVWNAFLTNTKNFVHIVCCDKKTNEQVIYDIWKNMEGYTIETKNNGEVKKEVYPYLNDYKVDKNEREYVLASKEGLTYQEWEHHIFSKSEFEETLKLKVLFRIKED